MRTRRLTPLVVAAALVVGLGACGDDDGGAAGGRVDVVAGFYPLAEAVQRVGGDRVTVENLTPAGAEPHDLELTPDQVDAIQDAALVVLMGDGFQPALEDAADRRDGPTLVVLDELDGAGDDGGDPHVWLDPVRYGEIVDVVTRALIDFDPSHREEYERNAAALRAEIDRVDEQYRTGLRDCARRTIVTAHDAFGHLARRYGLTQEAIAGIDPDAEPGAQRLAELADLVAEEGITTIFTEELVSTRVADALAREAGGVRTETLNPLEGLTRSERDRGDDWASVMGRNLTKLRAALGCR